MVTKKSNGRKFLRGMALLVGCMMVTPFAAAMIGSKNAKAAETTFVEDKSAQYGNELVMGSHYDHFPMEMVSKGENLVVGGGTYDNYLANGVTSATVERATVETKTSSIWANSAWSDSPASIVKDGDNSYIKLSYVSGSGNFAHFIQEFTNTGATTYLVEFDYYMGGSTTDCQAVLNDSTFANNPCTAIIGTGTAIQGKDGWYRFSQEITASSSEMKYLRVWFRTGKTTANYLLVDNVSIKEMSGEGGYVLPTEIAEIPHNIWSFVNDAPAVIKKEGNNAVLSMFGANYSSFYYGYQFEKSGVYAYSFDFKPEGASDNNIGFRINPVNDTYTFDVPLRQFVGEWKESALGTGWYHFVFYIKIDDTIAYKDGSFQFWCQSKNISTLTIDNLSVKRLVSAELTGNPVWGSERIYDGGFEKMLGNAESYTVPNGLNEENLALSSARSNEEESAAVIKEKNKINVATLSGNDGYSSVVNKVNLQNEGKYRVQIRYAVTDGYESQQGAALTYALGANEANDILANSVDDGDGYKLFTQYVTLTAEEAAAINEIAVRFACVNGFAADIDYVSVQKQIGSDIPQEEAPEDDGDLTGKKRYDLILGGDFEGYDVGKTFADEVTPELWGSVSLDMPATVVKNDKDTTNTTKVALLKHLAGSTKDFSSAFNIYTGKTELEKGRTYYVTFDYKYNIEESLDTEVTVGDGRTFTMDEGFTFNFVGGTNIGHHEIWLGSVEDGDMTIGANSQKYEISKTDLGDGWARIQFAFKSNTGLSIACNSIRFLLLTNKNPDNYAMIDNVALYTYYDAEDQIPEDKPPVEGGDENPGEGDGSGENQGGDNTGNTTSGKKKKKGCKSSISLTSGMIFGLSLFACVVAIDKKRRN